MTTYNSLISNQSAGDFLFIDEEFSYINQPQELSLQEINFNLRNQMEFGYLGKDKHLYKNISFFPPRMLLKKLRALLTLTTRT